MRLETLEYIKYSFLNLRNAISEIEDEKERLTWQISIAADFLHTAPVEVRKKFFETYEDLRSEVVELFGEEDI